MDALAFDENAFEMPEDKDVISFYDESQSEFDCILDAESEFRCSGIETEFDCGYRRHYESYQVAKKLDSGIWVSWTYWYGGGKHGEPDAIDWISDAYFVDCKEKEVTVIQRVFSVPK